MLFTLFKLFVSGGIIAFAAWLSGKRPELAGFIIALPLMTLLVLPFSMAEHRDPSASVRFAQSIFAAVPISMLFFVPFLLASKLNWGFWGLYGAGVALLAAGFFLHRYVMSLS